MAEEAERADSFVVRAGEHEGPLELILDLVEKRRLLVNELSLAQVTDDFIAHVRGGEDFPMEAASEFISVAATLLLIKSKSLLPDLELTQTEEEDIDALTRRLKLYEAARDAARELGRAYGKRVMASRGEREPEAVFAPSRDLSRESIERALRELLAGKEKEEALPEVRVRPLVSIEEMMDTLRSRVERALTLSFKEFIRSKTEKVEVIVSFLALLELVKQGAVSVEQYGAWGDISIKNTSTGVPHYG